MKIDIGLFPGGKLKALIMSYDDGRSQDRRLVELFNKYGIKGTFNLISGSIGNEKYVKPEEVKELYKGHEVACHTVNHPFLNKIGANAVLTEIFEDKKNLEALVGYPVRGIAYPYGPYNESATMASKSAGMEYARTGKWTGNFEWPDDTLEFHPTCHHDIVMNFLDEFLESQKRRGYIFSVVGHSFEFDYKDNWDFIEDFCKKVSNRDDIWYATHVEVAEYINATRSLKFSADCTMVYNPTAIDVWIWADEKAVVIPSGKTINLE